ncbi:MAG: OmpA family protein [Deltaproteobacteria bacterium]|nr:OmpA family protein [Deltaproteobacteria bacterium]MBW2398310.1 OmpA family protein [Deltaproteobacteria bacterium]MBW2666981.1 OmpA family protein [Deltaproteobacteria bacterium]
MRFVHFFLVAALLVSLGCASSPPPPPPPPPAPVAPAPPPPDPTSFNAVVPFDSGSATLDDAGIRALDEFARKLRPFPKRSVHVVGYSEESAADGADEWMSERRAKSVASYLVALGIPIDRITLQGRGSASASSLGGASGNRVVEVSVR